MSEPAAERPPGPARVAAIVLLNFGGPRTLAEVRPFLFEILRDPNTIQLPLPGWAQDVLAARIVARRGPVVEGQYGLIGGGSPIVASTARIAEALGAALADSTAGGMGSPPRLFVAHRYLAGWCARVAGEIVAAGVDDLLALPLYPHYSYATTGSALQQLAAALRAAGFAGRLSALRSYPDAPGYLDAMAERLQATLRAAAPEPAATVILCSAHGLPARYVERGDPYRLELYRTLEALRSRFPGWRFALSFQSRVGPAEWLRPYTDEILKELAGQGTHTLVFLPLSFVNDHLETLYEVERLYFPPCRELGMTPHRVAAIEDHPGFIETLAAYARAWDAGRAGVPAAELLPPDQHWRRVGRWSWLAWALALLGALWLAFC